MLLLHRIVDEVLVEAAILHGGREAERSGEGLWDAEAIAHQLAAAGLDGVVVGENAIMPDLVEIVELTLVVDDAVGEGMGGGVEIAVGLEKSAFDEGLASGILHDEVDPG